MLHILNGSSTESTLRRSSITGEFFSFRDALVDGPAPLELDEASWRETRAAHLSQSYGVPREKCERDLLEQAQTLTAFVNHEEVVLWFEQDLFCQLNLLYLLNWFSQDERQATKLSLINPGSFAGRPNFRGLGELTPEELASLFPTRQPVSPVQLELARNAWTAFTSSDPTSIEELLRSDTAAFPFLAIALRAQLRRFPSVRNGLGEIENTGLKLVAEGRAKFEELYLEFVNTNRVFGFGDAQIWLALMTLARAETPLLIARNENATSHLSNVVHTKTSFSLTGPGEAVLEGNADFVRLNNIDHWLGGVHLQGKQVWRWDAPAGRIKYC